MSSVDLLEVEPDKLFQVYSVNEVEEILRNVTNEIERKRVELRTLVGERYRELIEAADKINEMKDLSQTVIKDVDVLNYNISLINKPSFEPPLSHNKAVAIGPNDSTVAQLKLLLDLPSIIWNSIDEKDLIRAAQFYLLGRHIKTGFSVDKSLKESKFGNTILEEQWTLLSKFPGSILKSAETHLVQKYFEPTDCGKWLAAVGLLESGCLVDKFLALRYSCISNILQVDSNVKSRIVDSYNAIISSIEAFNYCFCDNAESGKSQVYRILEELKQPVVHYLGPLSYSTYLPTIISNFRAKWNGKLPTGSLKEKLDQWLTSVESLVASQGSALLNNVSSLRGLEQLNNGPGMGSTEVASTIPAGFHSSELWDRIYVPLVTDRAKQLLTTQWEEALSHVCKHISTLVQEDIISELDLRWFVWKEQASDLNFEQNQNYTERGLWLKGRGVSPRVSGSCLVLESEVGGVSSQGGPSLAPHHAARASAMLLSLKEFLSELCLKDEPVHTPQHHAALLTAIARFLNSVPLLCPSLHKALSYSSDSKVASSWHEAKTLLNAESLAIWSRWESAMASILVEDIKSTMSTPTKYSDLLASIPVWEVKMIEEGDEGNKSEVRVPSAPSLPLHNCLHIVTSKLTRVHLPRSIQENVMRKLVPILLSYIPDNFLCQYQAFQALFDVKFLSQLFTSSANKEIHGQCLSKIKSIEAKIDPFDLDVYSPHIHSNVKNSVLQTQCVFGSSLMNKDSGSLSKVSEDPSILILSKTSANLWFPPLPVTNPSYKHLHLNKTKPSRNSKIRPINVDSKASNMAASSFFTEWFG